MSRVSKDAYYMGIARAVAVRSTCLRHRYGAVLVNNDEIAATGYNGAPRGEPNCCDLGSCYREACGGAPVDARAATHGAQYGACVAVHAETNCLLSAGRGAARGATLYLACLPPGREAAPCNYCDRLIRNAGVVRLVTALVEEAEHGRAHPYRDGAIADVRIVEESRAYVGSVLRPAADDDALARNVR
ncbi:MAG: cytidine deaminase [Oscillospiraceae bacterium]|jgi:dCMP deaminase|nr:cytidine deaminase [Oscillospiraceae bacterium]